MRACPKGADCDPEAVERELARRRERQEQIDEAAGRLGVSMEDAKRYIAALLRWSKAGFPVRTVEEVKQIHWHFCLPCEYYIDGRCRKCGCGVSTSRLAVLNKIKMATEQCPEKHW